MSHKNKINIQFISLYIRFLSSEDVALWLSSLFLSIFNEPLVFLSVFVRLLGLISLPGTFATPSWTVPTSFPCWRGSTGRFERREVGHHYEVHRKYVNEIMLDEVMFWLEPKKASWYVGRKKGQVKKSMLPVLKTFNYRCTRSIRSHVILDHIMRLMNT